MTFSAGLRARRQTIVDERRPCISADLHVGRFSTYMHMLRDGRLLGIMERGREARERGAGRRGNGRDAPGPALSAELKHLKRQRSPCLRWIRSSERVIGTYMHARE
jgi:hypothetical protein